VKRDDLIAVGIGDGKLAVIGRLLAEMENGRGKLFETRHYLKTIDCHIHVRTWPEGELTRCGVKMGGKYPQSLLDQWTQEIMDVL
jgi:hypothetical protein